MIVSLALIFLGVLVTASGISDGLSSEGMSQGSGSAVGGLLMVVVGLLIAGLLG